MKKRYLTVTLACALIGIYLSCSDMNLSIPQEPTEAPYSLSLTFGKIGQTNRGFQITKIIIQAFYSGGTIPLLADTIPWQAQQTVTRVYPRNKVGSSYRLIVKTVDSIADWAYHYKDTTFTPLTSDTVKLNLFCPAAVAEGRFLIKPLPDSVTSILIRWATSDSGKLADSVDTAFQKNILDSIRMNGRIRLNRPAKLNFDFKATLRGDYGVVKDTVLYYGEAKNVEIQTGKDASFVITLSQVYPVFSTTVITLSFGNIGVVDGVITPFR